MNEYTEGHNEYAGWRIRPYPQPADGDGLPRIDSGLYKPTGGSHRRKNTRKEKWKRAAEGFVVAVCTIGVVYGTILSVLYWRW